MENLAKISGFFNEKTKTIIFPIFDTVNSRFKKDLNLQIHPHKTFFSDDQFLESVHKSFLNQTTLDLRKKTWGFLNRQLTVLNNKRMA